LRPRRSASFHEHLCRPRYVRSERAFSISTCLAGLGGAASQAPDPGGVAAGVRDRHRRHTVVPPVQYPRKSPPVRLGPSSTHPSYSVRPDSTVQIATATFSRKRRRSPGSCVPGFGTPNIPAPTQPATPNGSATSVLLGKPDSISPPPENAPVPPDHRGCGPQQESSRSKLRRPVSPHKLRSRAYRLVPGQASSAARLHLPQSGSQSRFDRQPAAHLVRVLLSLGPEGGGRGPPISAHIPGSIH